MKEQLILFDTAKLTKEKGFDEQCRFICRDEFDEKEKKIDKFRDFIDYLEFSRNSLCANNDYTIPTQSLLQKWLREKHHIDVLPSFDDNSNEYYYFIHTNNKKPYSNRVCSLPLRFSIYEEALEKGLQEALKLIKDDK